MPLRRTHLLLSMMNLTWLMSGYSHVETASSGTNDVPLLASEEDDPCHDENNKGGIVEFFSRITNIMTGREEDDASRAIANRGRKYEEENDYDKAFQCYDKAIKKKPHVSSYYKLRGELFFKTEQREKAIQDLKKATELSYAVDKECHKRLSEALFSMGRYKEAVDEIIPINDDEEFVKLGHKMFFKGEVEEAIRCYSKAIDMKPRNARYYRLRGNCYMLVDKAREGIADLESATRKHDRWRGDNSLNRASLAHALVDIRQFDDAINVPLPRTTNEIISLANTLHSRGAYKDALRCYDKIIDEHRIGGAEHYRNRGHCHRALESLDAAILDFGKAIEMDPSNTESRIDMGEALIEAKRYDEVIDVVKDLDTESMGSRDAGRFTKIHETMKAMKESKETSDQLKNSLVTKIEDIRRVEDDLNKRTEERHTANVMRGIKVV